MNIGGQMTKFESKDVDISVLENSVSFLFHSVYFGEFLIRKFRSCLVNFNSR